MKRPPNDEDNQWGKHVKLLTISAIALISAIGTLLYNVISAVNCTGHGVAGMGLIMLATGTTAVGSWKWITLAGMV